MVLGEEESWGDIADMAVLSLSRLGQVLLVPRMPGAGLGAQPKALLVCIPRDPSVGVVLRGQRTQGKDLGEVDTSGEG